MQASTDFTPTTDLINGSPKNMVTFFLLNECREFSRAMQKPDGVDIDSMTADLLSYCPEITRRDQLWDSYIDRKKKIESQTTAAILTKGDFWAYICEVLEFTDRSAGAF
jgi:hypothetical protein